MSAHALSIYKPRPERWPQLSLRGFFILVSLVCCFFAWLAVQVKWIHDRHEALRWVKEHPAWGGNVLMIDKRPPLPWSLAMLGEKSRYQRPLNIGIDGDDAPEDQIVRDHVEALKALFPEAHVVVTPNLFTKRMLRGIKMPLDRMHRTHEVED